MIRTILVALDESERAAAVLDRAAEIAGRFDATLHLFRAVFVPPEFPPAAHVDCADELGPHLCRQAEEQLRAILKQAQERAAALPTGGTGPKDPAETASVLTAASIRVASGEPWRAILHAADEVGADLVVVGSHGYRGLDRLLGTNAGKVANRAHRDVLVVHTWRLLDGEDPGPCTE